MNTFGLVLLAELYIVSTYRRVFTRSFIRRNGLHSVSVHIRVPRAL